MTEAADIDINQSLGVTPESPEPVEQAEPEVAEPEESNEPQYSDAEVKAMDGGWVPKDQFNGPDDNWKSAKSFNEFGDQQAKIRNLSSQIKKHGSEMKDLNKLWAGQLESQADELKTKFNSAVEEGNVEEANAIAAKQANVAAQQDSVSVEPAQTDNQALKDQWELDNSYVFEPDNPKTKVANVAFQVAQRQGKDMVEALAFVEEQVAEKFPERRGNDNRLIPSAVSSGGAAPRAV